MGKKERNISNQSSLYSCFGDGLHSISLFHLSILSFRDLEEYVDQLRTDSSPSSDSHPGQLSVTLKDVEEGAVNLRRVGEALAGLKGEAQAG